MEKVLDFKIKMAVYTYGTLLVLLVCVHCVQAYDGPYMGCYKDRKSRAMDESARLTKISNMTVELCGQYCRTSSNYTFLGVQYSVECFCGDSYDQYGNASNCNRSCSGNSSQICGGGWANNVYAVCPKRHWGRNCERQCHCDGVGVCMRKNGTCNSRCQAGWLGASCNVQDCTNNNGECNHTCHQRNGSALCSCFSGYVLDADQKGCSDVNECANRTHQCSAGEHFCLNYDGGYVCSCPQGHSLQANHYTCADIDECSEGQHGCSAGNRFCHNTYGNYTCSCPNGYQLKLDLHNCADIDECSQGQHVCSAGGNFCANTNGNYICSCPAGYKLELKHNCTDADECREGQHGCSAGDAFCANTEGSYNCSCPNGYKLEADNHNCTDVDECSQERHMCSAGDNFCTNTKGSYNCSCPKGYQLELDVHNCTDIDECSEEQHACSVLCINTEGSYTCSCPNGYALKLDNHTCTDIDECVEPKQLCQEGGGFCHNINGSYTCSCPEGHRLESDKYTCADIDECMEGRAECSAGIAFCNNTKGSYTCFCPTGYGLILDNHTCLEPKSIGPPIIHVVLPVIALIIVLTLAIVAVVLFRRGVLWRCWRLRDEKSASKHPPDIIPGILVETVEDAETSMSNTVAYVGAGMSLSPSMKILLSDLGFHIERLSRQRGRGFQEEFAKILDNKRGSCDAARTPAVKDKNKFTNILPYDHSRVVLGRNLMPRASDYINASYIKIDDKIAYIATQGPQKIGTEEFWEMVWQEESHLVVMLTNPVEGGKVKCMVYWPEEGTTKYGRINITFVGEERLPDFVRRTLIIEFEGVEREVRQYHFTSWPDHRVPDAATGILKMMRKVRGEPSQGKLTIIHCSAGVGRTGTYIAIDQQLKQAEREGTLDVLACVDELRNSRMNMVQTTRQYGFIYSAILEDTTTGPTSIPCASYLQDGRCKDDILITATTHYKFLESTRGLPQEEELSVGHSADNAPKNRSYKNTPQNSFRVILGDGGDDYINAASVTGFVRTDEFISIQLPLENTTEDFWRMLFGYKCTTVLILESDQTLQEEPCFLPGLTSPSVRYGSFTVKLTDEKETKNHKVLNLELMKEESIYENTVKASKPRKADAEEPKPLGIRVVKVKGNVTSEFLIDIYAKIQKWQGQGHAAPVVVVCLDGVSKCGLYIATSLLLNMVNHEQEVDVFYATRTIRKYRRGFITSEEQYRFLHQTAAEYLNAFETYSNFN